MINIFEHNEKMLSDDWEGDKNLFEVANNFEKMYNESERVYHKDYSTGEYCHEQSFKWGFQEGFDFEDSFAKVHLNYRRYYINTNGNFYDLDKNPINNINENRRRVVRITESQLRNTIKSVVTQYLNESRRQ